MPVTLTPARRRALEIVRDNPGLSLDQFKAQRGGSPAKRVLSFNLLWHMWQDGLVIYDGNNKVLAFDIRLTPAGLAALEDSS